MQEITNFLKQNEKLIFGVTTSCLLSYLFFRNRFWNGKSQKKPQNLLDVSLQKLIANKSHARIKKIVITTGPSSKGDFRKNLINFLKSRLTEEQIKVLINCSPQKLLRAGCQCFLQSMQPDDSQYLQYYGNALKAQFLIEDTISNIELISDNSNNSQIVMICDNNPFDIKLLNKSEHLWTQFLDKYNIKEADLIDGYDLVIHVIDGDSVKAEDQRIQQVWSKSQQYHQIIVNQHSTRDNFDIALNKITTFLALCKQQVVLQS